MYGVCVQLSELFVGGQGRKIMEFVQRIVLALNYSVDFAGYQPPSSACGWRASRSCPPSLTLLEFEILF